MSEERFIARFQYYPKDGLRTLRVSKDVDYPTARDASVTYSLRSGAWDTQVLSEDERAFLDTFIDALLFPKTASLPASVIALSLEGDVPDAFILHDWKTEQTLLRLVPTASSEGTLSFTQEFVAYINALPRKKLLLSDEEGRLLSNLNKELGPRAETGRAVMAEADEKSDPRRGDVDPHVPGAKLDHGKNRLGLTVHGFARALEAVGHVSTFGAAKYTPNGWKTVPDGDARYTDALYRHLLRHGAGERFDPESGLPHLAHAAWNMLVVLELDLRAWEADMEEIARQLRGAVPTEVQEMPPPIITMDMGSQDRTQYIPLELLVPVKNPPMNPPE